RCAPRVIVACCCELAAAATPPCALGSAEVQRKGEHASSPARMWNAPSTRDPARKLRDGCMPCPPKLTPYGKMRAAATTATLAVHGSSLQALPHGMTETRRWNLGDEQEHAHRRNP